MDGQRPSGPDDVHLVGLVEIFDIFARYMRRGVSDLIERGNFPEPYQEIVGLSVWDRDDIDRWLGEHPEVVQNLLVMVRDAGPNPC
jgi:hypothetical protein